ncbi:hypothetical protein EBS80_00630 [bacterium]|nr:hypothetical protein [bacterium]
MNRALLSVLIVSLLLAFSTMVGMSIFGMNGGMHADMDTTGTDCLTHCLSVASSTTTVVSPSAVTLGVILVVLALVFSEWPLAVPASPPFVLRWREGIGKLLLGRNLSTVILLD